MATFGARNDMSEDTPIVPSGRKGKKVANTPADPVPILSSFGRRSPYVESVTCENPKDRDLRLKYLKAQLTAQIGTLFR